MGDYDDAEDLPSLELTDEQLETVSGSAIYMKYGDIKGSVTTNEWA
jgi:hypothetical protein